eukprot:COSAG01_NODE_186_length_22652_cov_7.562630_8_plen_212_part_00
MADVIKTHHNRVPEIDALIEAGLVIEPCAELYKDEVRAVGEKLGLPKFLVWRHPFPGPGLGVRLLCHPGTVDEDVDASALRESEAGIAAMADSLTVSIPHLKSVGVQGDSKPSRRAQSHLFPVLTLTNAHRQNIQALRHSRRQLSTKMGSARRSRNKNYQHATACQSSDAISVLQYGRGEGTDIYRAFETSHVRRPMILHATIAELIIRAP